LSGARRLAAVALALAMVGAVGLIVVERTLAPRGLKLDAVDPDATPPRVLQRLDRQEPLLDAGRNPIDAAAEHGLAAWRGFLRVPAFFFTNHLHLTTNRPCSIEIGGKTVFEAAASDSVQRVVMTEKVDLGRGFYPILIMLTYPDRGALLHVRWSIQDFAFQELIGRDNFFARPPTGFVGLLVAAEFHLLATACATGFLLLVLLLDARRRAAS
jgi:hypothetical protein